MRKLRKNRACTAKRIMLSGASSQPASRQTVPSFWRVRANREHRMQRSHTSTKSLQFDKSRVKYKMRLAAHRVVIIRGSGGVLCGRICIIKPYSSKELP